MPTYEYQCDACEHQFDEFQNFSDKPLKKCPKCGKPKLRRLLGTGAAVIFKGSGFYQTDYRSDSYKEAAKADADGAKPASDKSSTETKSDLTASSDTPKETKPAGKKSKASK
jgi:putative FmdB family regulatory protein